MARPKRPIAPLIPEDELKLVVAGLLAVPKDRIVQPKPSRKMTAGSKTKATAPKGERHGQKP